MTIKDYLALVADVYADKGGLEGQRGPLTSKTGISIRNRMISDIKSGAVLPAVVVGVHVEHETMAAIQEVGASKELVGMISTLDRNSLSIIDGMQRTTAMSEALAAQQALGNREIRVEFWISEHLNSLIYRMLILNTGQVPWELTRQLETVYGQFLSRIRKALGARISIFQRDEKRRRYAGAQYQSNTIIELFLLFSSRRSEMDIKDRIAEDFARLDIIETTSHIQFLTFFIDALSMLADLDVAFSRLDVKFSESNKRFNVGKDIFASSPAMSGFITAISTWLFDEPGFAIDWDAAPAKLAVAQNAVQVVVAKLNGLSKENLSAFLQLELLEQRLSQRSGQVGRFEREYFRKAFNALLRHAERLEDMTPCWMA